MWGLHQKAINGFLAVQLCLEAKDVNERKEHIGF